MAHNSEAKQGFKRELPKEVLLMDDPIRGEPGILIRNPSVQKVRSRTQTHGKPPKSRYGKVVTRLGLGQFPSILCSGLCQPPKNHKNHLRGGGGLLENSESGSVFFGTPPPKKERKKKESMSLCQAQGHPTGCVLRSCLLRSAWKTKPTHPHPNFGASPWLLLTHLQKT